MVYEQAEDGGWGAYLPDLPGVVAIGSSRAEVAERIEEAVAAYALELHKAGKFLPEPVHEAGIVRAKA